MTKKYQGDQQFGGSYVRGIRFASPFLLVLANLHSLNLVEALSMDEIQALRRPFGEYGKDIMEGLLAEGLATNGLPVLVDGLDGTLAFRRIDASAWDRVTSGQDKHDGDDRMASLEKLDLKRVQESIGTDIPLNTILKESPDKRKADLIMICHAPGSKRAFVVRIQIKMRKDPETVFGDA